MPRSRPPHPQTHCGDLANPPQALTPLCLAPRWVTWKWQLDNGRWTKPPFRADNPERHAESDNRETWGDRHTAVRAVLAGKADGVGFVLTNSDIGAIDPATGAIEVWAQRVLDAAPDAYQEITVSGTGLRIIGIADGSGVHRAFKVDAQNAREAIKALGIVCSYDEFHDRMRVGGEVINQWAGELSDAVNVILRQMIVESFNFDPGKEHVADAATELCLENRFDPVLDYLDELDWDGTPRLERWLTAYLGAEDTPLNRAIGKLTLVAAVRRARKPGCKFDHILVLEGPEGTMKSTSIVVLAGVENFSDQTILTNCVGDTDMWGFRAAISLEPTARLTVSCAQLRYPTAT
jgi:hypothetical protein